MNRRRFIQAAAGAGLASMAYADDKPRRVGLIGCGWYGKIDILRLIQIAPVEVVSLCDVDSKMLSDAADIIATPENPLDDIQGVRRVSFVMKDGNVFKTE